MTGVQYPIDEQVNDETNEKIDVKNIDEPSEEPGKQESTNDNLQIPTIEQPINSPIKLNEHGQYDTNDNEEVEPDNASPGPSVRAGIFNDD